MGRHDTCKLNSHHPPRNPPRIEDGDKQLLPAATKLGQGNIFASVCQEFCPQGGVSASVHAGIAPRDQTPQSRHPPPPDQTPRADTPGPDQIPPRADTPWKTPPSPPDQTPPGTRHPPSNPPPPGKQTAAYGLRAAGMHPSGMHSC